MNPMLAYAANQIHDPLIMGVISAMAVVVVGFVLWNAFGEKPTTRRTDRRERPARKPRREASISGRFS